MATQLIVPREELVYKLNRRPFVPFVVRLSNGHEHNIVRVAQMGIGQTIGTIGSPTGDQAWHIKLGEILSIDDL